MAADEEVSSLMASLAEMCDMAEKLQAKAQTLKMECGQMSGLESQRGERCYKWCHLQPRPTKWMTTGRTDGQRTTTATGRIRRDGLTIYIVPEFPIRHWDQDSNVKVNLEREDVSRHPLAFPASE